MAKVLLKAAEKAGQAAEHLRGGIDLTGERPVSIGEDTQLIDGTGDRKIIDIAGDCSECCSSECNPLTDCHVNFGRIKTGMSVWQNNGFMWYDAGGWGSSNPANRTGREIRETGSIDADAIYSGSVLSYAENADRVLNFDINEPPDDWYKSSPAWTEIPYWDFNGIPQHYMRTVLTPLVTRMGSISVQDPDSGVYLHKEGGYKALHVKPTTTNASWTTGPWFMPEKIYNAEGWGLSGTGPQQDLWEAVYKVFNQDATVSGYWAAFPSWHDIEITGSTIKCYAMNDRIQTMDPASTATNTTPWYLYDMPQITKEEMFSGTWPSEGAYFIWGPVYWQDGEGVPSDPNWGKSCWAQPLLSRHSDAKYYLWVFGMMTEEQRTAGTFTPMFFTTSGGGPAMNGSDRVNLWELNGGEAFAQMCQLTGAVDYKCVANAYDYMCDDLGAGSGDFRFNKWEYQNGNITYDWTAGVNSEVSDDLIGGGVAPFIDNMSGNLPPGLSYSFNSGTLTIAISGTPTDAAANYGEWPVQFDVTDSTGDVALSCFITINVLNPSGGGGPGGDPGGDPDDPDDPTDPGDLSWNRWSTGWVFQARKIGELFQGSDTLNNLIGNVTNIEVTDGTPPPAMQFWYGVSSSPDRVQVGGIASVAGTYRWKLTATDEGGQSAETGQLEQTVWSPYDPNDPIDPGGENPDGDGLGILDPNVALPSLPTPDYPTVFKFSTWSSGLDMGTVTKPGGTSTFNDTLINGTAPYTLTLPIVGAPANLSVSEVGGSVSVSVPTTFSDPLGVYNFTIEYTDNNGDTAQAPVTIEII